MELLRVRHRRLGRRRQDHADRAAALDTKQIFEDQLEARRAHEPRPGLRLHEPRAAHRRPAGRARAGHHHRRRLPLLRHADAASSSSPTRPATCSTRATWSPARRPPTSRSSSSTPARACSSSRAATPSSRRCCRCRTSCCASTRWTSSTTTRPRFDEIRDEFTEFAAKLDIDDLTFIPISALHGDNVVAALAQHAVVRGPDAAAPPRGRLHRLRPQPDRRALPGAVRDPAADATTTTTTAATPARSPAASSGPATRSWCCRPASRTTIAAIDDCRRPGRRGVPADVGDDPPRRRPRREPGRHDLPAEQHADGRPRTSTRWSAGSRERAAAGRAPRTRSSTRPARRGPGAGPPLPPRRQHAAPRRGRTARSR